MQIRPATATDLAALTEVQAAAMVASDYYEEAVALGATMQYLAPRLSGYFAGTYHPQYARGPRAVFAAAEAEQITGFIAGHHTERLGCAGEVQWLFVAPAWQRHGVGTALLHRMADWFEATAARRVIVDAPPDSPARPFYLRQGAQPLDTYWLFWEDISARSAAK